MTSAAHDERRNLLVSILLTCFGYACYNVGDVAMKFMAGKFHFSQLFFTNGSIILVFMVSYGWFKEGKKAFRTKKPGWMFMRAATSQIVGLCNIAALPHIHLATFYTLVFTSPFWLALISARFLGDKLTKRRMMIILGGFAVILFMFRPGGEFWNVWSILVSISAILYAAQMVMVRHIGASESRPFMISCGAVMSVIISIPFLSGHYIEPNLYEWSLFFLMSIVGSIGLLCMTYAFQITTSASILAPYHYTQIVWGAIFGYFIFNEVPSIEVMLGAALIILSGIYLIHSETKQFAKSLKP